MIEEKEFVESLMTMIHQHRIAQDLSEKMEDWEEEFFEKEELPRLFKEGYSKEDAYRFVRHTEHVNPRLDENYACKQMKIIADKYDGNLK